MTKVWPKIEGLVKTSKFWLKSKVLSQIKALVKNKNFGLIIKIEILNIKILVKIKKNGSKLKKMLKIKNIGKN